MKIFNKTIAILMVSIMVAFSGVLVGCNDDDEDTNQFVGGVSLNSFGPSPVSRGGYVRFIGSGMDQITSVAFPGGTEVTDIVAVNSREIKVVVPQDAEVGYLTLYYNDGEIVTKTKLGYAEPISIESVSPMSLKAGDIVTIKGEYLNLMHQVIIGGAVIDEKAFASHTRSEITLRVPIEAKSGVISVCDGAEEPNEIPFDEKVVVALPTVTAIAPSPIKAGSTLTLKGTLLNLVSAIEFANADVIKLTTPENPYAEVGELKVVVPEKAISGAVKLICYSDEVVETEAIEIIEPVATIENKKASYGIDDIVTIAGTDLDLVSTATFTNGEPIAVEVSKEGKIELKVVAAFQTGDITLTLKNGTTVAVEGFVTTKPVPSFPEAATPLDVLDVKSTLGNRVKVVKFGDIEVEAKSTEDGFSVIVPLEAESCELTIVMDNGETVKAGNITINGYSFCAVKEFAAEQTTIGDLLKCTVKNGANLTGVLLSGEATSYILNGDVLFVNVGQKTGTFVMTLVSGETKVDYKIKVVGAGLVETVIYDTPLSVVGWGGAKVPVLLPNPLPANSKIRIRVAEANSVLQVLDGNWGKGPDYNLDDSNKNEVDIPAADFAATGYVDVDLSFFHDNDGNPWWNGEIMFNADGVIVSSISIVIDYSAPTAIWSGSAIVADWKTSFDALTWGKYDFSSLSVGQTIYVYYTSEEGGKMRIGNGNWAAFPSTMSIAAESGDDSGEGNIIISAGSSFISFVLTSEDIESIQNNGGFGVYGGNFTITEIALK